MVDLVWPEDEGTGAASGDKDDAANFATGYYATGFTDRVRTGLNLTYDSANLRYDVSAGIAVIQVGSVTADQSGEVRDQGNSFVALLDSRSNISLTDNAVNEIYVDIDLSSDDTINIVTLTAGTPSNDWIKIGEIDTSNDTVDEDFNRSYEFDARVDVNGHDLSDGSTTIWDTSAGQIPQGSYQGIDIDDSGADVIDATGIDFTTNLTVTDDGDGTVTVSASGSTLATEDDGSSVVSDTSTLDFGGSDFDVSNPTSGEAQVSLTNDSVTVAGNSVSLGGSTGVALADLSDVGGATATDGFVLASDGTDYDGEDIASVTEAHVALSDLSDVDTTVDNSQLTNSAVTVTAGDGLSGGGSVSLGGSTTLDARLDIEDGGTDVTGAFGINFGSNLAVTDDADNTVTVDASTGGGSAVEVQEDGTQLTTDVTLIDVQDGLTATEPATDEIDLNIDSTEVAGAGLTTSGSPADLDVGAGTAITVNASDVQVTAGGITTTELDLSISPSWTGSHDFTGGGLLFPTATSPSPTTEGDAIWDTDDDVLRIGDGAATQTLEPLVQADYVTLTTDAGLDNERTLNAGNNLSLTDNGAGGDVTLDVDDAFVINTGDTITGSLTYDTGAGTNSAVDEAGIDRSSGSAETFNVQNSGTGAMTLQQDGTAVVTETRTLTGGDGIQAIGDLSADRTIDVAAADIAGAGLTTSGSPADIDVGAGTSITVNANDVQVTADGITTTEIDESIAPTWTGEHDFAGGGLILPTESAPTPTTEGDVVWDSDDDVLRIGNGSTTSTLDPSGGGGDFTLLRTIVASSQPTVDFSNGNIDSTYNTYMFILAGVRPATDQQGLILRLSNDGGTNWIAGSSYDYNVFVHNSSGTASRGGDGNSSIYLTDNTAGRPGSAAGEGVTAFISLDSPSDTGSYTRVNGNSNYDRNDNTTEGSLADGRYDTAEAINGVRFLFNSGNIATGIFELYGVG